MWSAGVIGSTAIEWGMVEDLRTGYTLGLDVLLGHVVVVEGVVDSGDGSAVMVVSRVETPSH